MMNDTIPNSTSLAVNDLFRVLAHPARLAILEKLRAGEQCVCHLEAVLGFRQAYLSQQLSVLRAAGLVEDRRDGWNIFYRVSAPQVYDLLQAAATLGATSQGSNREQTETLCPCPKCKKHNSDFLS